MKLPRDVSGRDLAQRLERFGYQITRQSGSHLRLTIQQGSEHHVTVPDHDALRVGTLAHILAKIAEHLKIERSELVERLFGAR